jgi:outer membrane receptor protein involved in Fe transport
VSHRCPSAICAVLVCAVLVALAADEAVAQDTKERKETTAPSLVFSASKLPKSLGEAPAIITVYRSDYLESFAFLTLNDLLQTTPGFEQRSASWYDTPATRGLGATALLMIDGTPINSHLTNTYPAGYELDLTNYKRVEVISGPGGVMWGAHSLLGVINLLSLDGADLNTVRGRIDLGSGGLQRYNVKAGGVWKGVDGFLSVSFALNRGANLSINGTTSQTTMHGRAMMPGVDGLTNNRSDYFFEALGKLTYGDFTLFARIPYSRNYYQVSEEGGLLSHSDNGFRQSDDWVAYLKYSHQFLERSLGVMAKAYVYRNVMTLDDRLWSANSQYPNGYGLFMDHGLSLKFGGLVEAYWTRRFGKYITNTVTGGFDALRESISGAKVSFSDANGFYSAFQPFIKDASAFVLSGYLSDDITLLDRVALSGGARYNYANTYSPVWLVSGSVVVRPWGQNYLKMNIASGLRPPTMAMRFGLAPYAAPMGEYQNPNSDVYPMRPDTSNAYQFEINSQILKDVWLVKNFFLRANFAYTSVENMRTLIQLALDPKVAYYLPKINRDIYSVETRLDASFEGGHSFWLSYAYNSVSIKNTDVEINLPQVGPKHAVSFGGSARLFRVLSLVARATFQTGGVSSMLVLDPSLPQGGTFQQRDVDPLYLVSAGAAVDRIWRDLRLSLWVSNILNRRYGYHFLQNFYAGGPYDAQALEYPQPGIGFMFSAQMSVL